MNFWTKFGVFKDVCGLLRCLSTASQRTWTFWANASLIFCLFRHPIKKFWREGRIHAPARLRRFSSGFGNLLSTLVWFPANGALWRVYYFVHRIIRPSVKITCAILSSTINVRMPPFLALRINRWGRFGFSGATVLLARSGYQVSFKSTEGVQLVLSSLRSALPI